MDDPIKKPGKTDKKVVEVYKQLRIFKDSTKRTEWLQRRKVAWDAIENDMYTSEEKEQLRKAGDGKKDSKGMDANVHNKIVKGVQGATAVVTSSRPEVTFLPVGSGDVYDSELMKRAHDLVWAKNEGTDVLFDMVQESKIGGIGFAESRVNYNYGITGVVEIEETSPIDYYWDVESRKRDFADTDLIKAKPRTAKYIREHYEGIKDEDLKSFSGVLEEIDTNVSTGIEGADNYAVAHRDGQNDPDSATKEEKSVWEIEAWMLRTRKEKWVVIEGPGGSPTARVLSKEELTKTTPEEAAEKAKGELWPRTITVREQLIIVGNKLVSSKINPLGTSQEEKPLVPIVSLPHQRTRTSYPMSPTSYALPINRDMNKRIMQFTLGISELVNAPLLLPTGQYRFTKPEGTPGCNIEVDQSAAFAPQRVSPGSSDLHKYIDLVNIDKEAIDDMYDLQDVVKGKLPNNQISGRAVLALQDLAGVMSNPFLRSLESAITRIGEIDIILIMKTWTRTQWERLIEPGELNRLDLEQDDIDPNAPEDPAIAAKWEAALERIRPLDPAKQPGYDLVDIDVRVTAGSSMPTNRMAKGAAAIELVNAGIYDQEAALDMIDDPGKDKVIARSKAAAKAAQEAELEKEKIKASKGGSK